MRARRLLDGMAQVIQDYEIVVEQARRCARAATMENRIMLARAIEALDKHEAQAEQRQKGTHSNG